VISKQEGIAYLLPGLCESCGAHLPGPGEPCGACGRIPAITRPEAEQLLDSATALASVEAKVLETEAEALYQAAMAKWQEASRVVHVALLQDRRDAVRKAADEHKRAYRRLLSPLARAEAAEEAAAVALAEVAARYDEATAAEELARKMKHGYDAEKQATQDLRDAAGIRDRYQGYLSDAVSKRKAAEAPVTASKARGDQLSKALADAEAELRNPGPAAIGRAAVIASPLRLLLEDKLDDDDTGMEIAREAGRAICDVTGVTKEIVAEARGQLLEEQEAAARGKPLHLRHSRDGVVASPNPHNTGTPQQFHPATSPPHTVTPSAVTGWG
jgi:hypothetical protein